MAKVSRKFEIKEKINVTSRLGHWNSGEEETFHLTSQDREDLSAFGIQKVYRVVVVQQPPFVFWNETKGDHPFTEVK